MMPAPAHIIIGLALGIGFGLVHFGSLRKVSALYLSGAAARAAGLQLLRLAALVALMVALAFLGAAALIAGALGLILAREIVLRRAREEE